MIKDIREIEELEEKIAELTPDYETKKKLYDDASDEYFKIKSKKQKMHSEIEVLKKKIQVEKFKKAVGKGELLSFRTFFDEIKKERDFTGKTMVWSFKNGKSGMFVNLRVNDNDVSKKLLESYCKNYIYNPDVVVDIVRDFPSRLYDKFCFNAFTVGSMVDGRTYYDMKLDDVFIFICDTKTIDDFEDIADTKELYFFEKLPYVCKSPGKTHKSDFDGNVYLSLGCSGVPKSHYKSYKLYPLKTMENGGGW